MSNLPLEFDDPVDPMFILYVFKENSRYNRRFQQRKLMKKLLGKKYRKLVERAKYKRYTWSIFQRLLTPEECQAIHDRLHVDAHLFWRLARGQTFCQLPKPERQLFFPFHATS